MTHQTTRAVGTVASIRVYPVRSMAGVEHSSVDVGAAGLAGDRAATVVGDDGRAVRGKDAPALRSVRPTGDAGADAATVSALLGRPVRVVGDADAPDGQAAVHLVSTAALARAEAGEVPEGCSAEDPRANLVLELSGDDDERAWVGRAAACRGRRPGGHPHAEALPGHLRRGPPRRSASPSATRSCSSLPP